MRVALGIVAICACGRIDFDSDGSFAACRIALDPLILGPGSTIGAAADGTYYGMGTNLGNELSITGTD